jgi:hypothetical protein
VSEQGSQAASMVYRLVSPASACCVLSFAAANSDGLPLPAAAAHHGWLARQYQQAAEMITGSRLDAATLQVRQHLAKGWSLDIDLAALGASLGATPELMY